MARPWKTSEGFVYAAVHMRLCLLNWSCERAWAAHRCKRAKGMAERDSGFDYNSILWFRLPPLSSQTSWHIAFVIRFKILFLFFLFFFWYDFIIHINSFLFCQSRWSLLFTHEICFFFSLLTPSSVVFFAVSPQAFLVSTIPSSLSLLSRPRCLRHKWFRLVIRQTKS